MTSFMVLLAPAQGFDTCGMFYHYTQDVIFTEELHFCAFVRHVSVPSVGNWNGESW